MDHLADLLFQKQLDWVVGDPENLTPAESPYAFSPHYLWRDKAKAKKSVSYPTDHLSAKDKPRYIAARKAAGIDRVPHNKVTKAQAQAFCDAYFEGGAECVGYVLSCNQSSGFQIGTFCVIHKSET